TDYATHAALFKCDTLCSEVERLPASVGTVGDEVDVSVPLHALELHRGRSISKVTAHTWWAGEGPVNAGRADSMMLRGSDVPAFGAWIGVAHPPKDMARVQFHGPIKLDNGRFSV